MCRVALLVPKEAVKITGISRVSPGRSVNRELGTIGSSANAPLPPVMWIERTLQLIALVLDNTTVRRASVSTGIEPKLTFVLSTLSAQRISTPTPDTGKV